ncbi:hypothetical protein ABEB36_013092 [Hypothenemus hampei]
MTTNVNAGRGEELRKLHFKFGVTQYFKVVISPAFVDKTLLIKALLEERKMVLITAPRRIGKTPNVTMKTNIVNTFTQIQVDENGEAIDPTASANYKIFKDNNLLIFQQADFLKNISANIR